MKILLIGCGHMGGAMLAGWLKRGDVMRIDVVDPNASAGTDARVHMHTGMGPAMETPDIAVLAVKPQAMKDVCGQVAPHLDPSVPVLSIAAGITLTSLAMYLGRDRPYIRAMPNTPGAIGKGISGFYADDKTSQKQIAMVESLLSALGEFARLSDESQIDSVTAVSGSGPAYVFALTEAIENAAISIGLDADLAARLARVTVIGAAGLMDHQKDLKPADLRRSVTSAGGTTAAALDVLGKNQGLDNLLEEAVKAALIRARELAQSQ